MEVSPATVKRQWTIARAWLEGGAAGWRLTPRALPERDQGGSLAPRRRPLRSRAGAPPPSAHVEVRSSAEPSAPRTKCWRCSRSPTPARFPRPPACADRIASAPTASIACSAAAAWAWCTREDTRLHRDVAFKSLPPHLPRRSHAGAAAPRGARRRGVDAPVDRHRLPLEEIGEHIFIVTEFSTARRCGVRWKRARCRRRVPSTSRSRWPRPAGGAQARHRASGSQAREHRPHAGGRLKMVDFGIARFEAGARSTLGHGLTGAGAMIGTPPYIAPEQLLGRTTNFHTDHFSFGVLLYEMVEGRHPFGSGGAADARSLGSLAAVPDQARMIAGELWSSDQPHAGEAARSDRFPATKALVAALLSRSNSPARVMLLRREPGPRLGSTHRQETGDSRRRHRRTGMVVRPPADRGAVRIGSWCGPTWQVHRVDRALRRPRPSSRRWRSSSSAATCGCTCGLRPAPIRTELGSRSSRTSTALVRAADVAFSLVMIGDRAGASRMRTPDGAALFVSFGLGGCAGVSA